MSIFKEDKPNKEKIEKGIIEKYNEEREKQIIRRYNDDIQNNEKMIKPFTEIIKDIIGDDTLDEFQDKTELGKDMFYNLKKRVNKDNPCRKSTIVSVCVGYGVGLQIAEELLRSQGSSFNPHSDRDSAYITLLTEYRGKSIEECNKLLEKLNVRKEDRLGVCARRPRKTKKKV